MYEKYAELRDSKEITDYRVASDTGITKSTFTDWKTGRSKPKADKLKILADYFDVPLTYFYEEHQNNAASLTTRDERDISKTVNDLMEKLEAKDGAPLFFDGTEMSPETKILFEQQLKSLVTTVKEINKVKFNPNKNKK